MRKRRKRKRTRKIKLLLWAVIVAAIVLDICLVMKLAMIMKNNSQENDNNSTKVEEATEQEIGQVSETLEMDKENYPEFIIHAYEKNSEMKEFVLEYPLKKETYSKEDLDAYLEQDKVPLFLQWDSRWGYYSYGSSIVGVTGCGPTCLSMVALHLLQDAELTPVYMSDYATEHGYYVEGVGTDWSFMTEGARALGLKVQEVSLTERIVKRHLQQGRPIICAMRAGDFTESGHFIVLVGVENGKIQVNDPNSRERSERLWEFEELEHQIRNMWAYSVR